jgi:ribokinase
MSKVFNLGSVNIDHVYHVPHFVRPGQTLPSTRYASGAGGKGFNQSVALARAGASVSHIGCIGRDGGWLRAMLAEEEVDCTHLREASGATGHAIIQVVSEGENAIILHPGANKDITIDSIRYALKAAKPEDWFLCQNETSFVPEALKIAKNAGLKTAYNAAPADGLVSSQAMAHVDFLFVNEDEAMAIGQCQSIEENLALIRERHPQTHVIATLGADGAIWSGPDFLQKATPPPCHVVDTTAAGDTFTGYCLAALIQQMSPADALALACRAATMSVTREGAASSIPRRCEIPSL